MLLLLLAAGDLWTVMLGGGGNDPSLLGVDNFVGFSPELAGGDLPTEDAVINAPPDTGGPATALLPEIGAGEAGIGCVTLVPPTAAVIVGGDRSFPGGIV